MGIAIRGIAGSVRPIVGAFHFEVGPALESVMTFDVEQIIQDQSLRDKVAIVTGVADVDAGLGLTTTEYLAPAGVHMPTDSR